MNKKLLSFALLLVLLNSGAGADAPGALAIQLNRTSKTSNEATFDVVGIPRKDLEALTKAKLESDQWTALFAVHVDSKDKNAAAMFGSYRVEAGMIRFEPRFPLALGVRYKARFDPSRLPGRAGGEPITAVFELPKPPAVATTVVEHVYPTCDKLPENQLKFYIHFTAPMSRGEAYKRIHLLNEAGKEVDMPFLELDEELWDSQSRRFTLFFDPGRIKRGLKPREEVGPSLEEGKSYTLLIDRQWEDSQSNPLKDGYRKSFKVGAPDDQPPDPKAWKVQAPVGGKTEPLVVILSKPMDNALLHRMITVVDARGQPMAGMEKVTNEETCWHFTPERAWQVGTYRIVVDTRLEDLAGNSVGRPFEVDVFRPVQRDIKTKTVEVPFEVR